MLGVATVDAGDAKLNGIGVSTHGLGRMQTGGAHRERSRSPTPALPGRLYHSIVALSSASASRPTWLGRPEHGNRTKSSQPVAAIWAISARNCSRVVSASART